MLKEVLTEDRHRSSSEFDVAQLIHDNALSGRNPDAAKHFYSNAQHACIASFLAEDIYGMKVAQAVIPKIFAEHRTGYVSLHLLDAIPEIAKLHDAVCQQLFRAFEVDESLVRSKEVDSISRMMLSIEHRDMIQVAASLEGFPEPLPEVEIASMSSRRANTALTLRVMDIFPGLDQKRLKKSLADSLIPQVLVMEVHGS